MMGHFSKQETERQNGGRLEGVNSVHEDGTIIPLEPGFPPYVINDSRAQRFASVLAVINRPRPMWHEGEGCSVNSCCCDPMEANQ
jgi:hypothetical protein